MKKIELKKGTLLVLENNQSVPINTDLDNFQILGHPSEINGDNLVNVIDDSLLGAYKTVPSLLFCVYGINETDVLLFKPNL